MRGWGGNNVDEKGESTACGLHQVIKLLPQVHMDDVINDQHVNKHLSEYNIIKCFRFAVLILGLQAIY